MKVVAIVPARYESARLPAKALKDICGKPMVWWVYQQTKLAEGVDEVYVATDDNRIVEVCESFGIPALMTKKTHREAAERLQEISEKTSSDFYLQINGDEPLINSDLISLAVPNYLPQDIEYGTNIITKIRNPVEVVDSSNIKVVFDKNFNALYMSRTVIPYPYKTLEFDYYKHVGIIGYNKKMLDFYADNPPGRFERIEGIATLRFTDYAKTLLCIEAENCESLSVDTQKDLDAVRIVVRKRIENKRLHPKLLKLLETSL
jgi:3-deoxy-manno-octulosonate cytidylyltransferase (CMP-KDO synthetase)